MLAYLHPAFLWPFALGALVCVGFAIADSWRPDVPAPSLTIPAHWARAAERI